MFVPRKRTKNSVLVDLLRTIVLSTAFRFKKLRIIQWRNTLPACSGFGLRSGLPVWG